MRLRFCLARFCDADSTILVTFPFFEEEVITLNIIIESGWWLRHIELILSKTIDVLAKIGRKCSHSLLIEIGSF